MTGVKIYGVLMGRLVGQGWARSDGDGKFQTSMGKARTTDGVILGFPPTHSAPERSDNRIGVEQKRSANVTFFIALHFL